MANTQSEAERERALGAGDFYGSVETRECLLCTAKSRSYEAFL